jgi:hypothetical protein
MSDREILLRWLASAAARLGWSRRMRELGWLACALVALRLLPEVLKVLGVPSLVLSALTPVLVIAALAVAALSAWRLASRTTLAHAAGAADTRAGLKDQLRSAQWFALRGPQDAFVELLLARAAQTVERLDARRLFPMAAPRSVLAALALAIFTGFLAWFSPRFALPVTPDAVASTAASGNTRDPVSKNEREKTIAELRSPDGTQTHDLSAAWAQLEQLAKELPPGAEEEAVKRAVTARDARLAAQLLQASERNRAAAVPKVPAGASQREMKTAAEAQRLLEALKGMSNQESKAQTERPIKSEVSPTVRTATRLREQAREERHKITGTPAQGQVTLNNRLRAVSRAGAGLREVPYGEGEAAEAGSQTSVSGAATGERTGRSQAGGSEGEHPTSSPTGAGDDQPVLGERTERLAAQLEKMRAERGEDSKRQEAVEEFYAATQRQASEVEYESITAQWRAQREAVVAPGGTPLSYREAVKQYFLSQHARED